MKVTLSLPYVVRPQERDMPGNYTAVDRQISDLMIRSAIDSRYKEGVKDKAIRRLVAAVFKKLTLAVAEKADHVELSLDQVQFVADSLEAFSPRADWVSWIEDLSDEVSRAKREDAEKTSKDEKK